MAGGRVFWQAVPTDFDEGTPAGPYHYTAHLGTLTADEPAGVLQHIFPNLTPGDYPSSVDTVAADGTVLSTLAGPTLHVPTPVSVPLASNVGVALVP